MVVFCYYFFFLCCLSFLGCFFFCFLVIVFYCKLFFFINLFYWIIIFCSFSIFIKLYVMNVKVCIVVELYGILDFVIWDWMDGLLFCIFCEINKLIDKNECKYIVFDSDVDVLWVENMNFVMDDNRFLILVNGERIWF